MRSLAEIKPLQNGEITPPFTDVDKSCIISEYMSFHFIREDNK